MKKDHAFEREWERYAVYMGGCEGKKGKGEI